MSEAVLTDAQFSIARVYRPFAGFEAVYQDQPVSTPIAIPGTLDSNAGRTGYDANLLAGIPTSYGSRLTLWLPTIFNESDGSLFIAGYRYRFVWRMRNLRDFISKDQSRPPYHFPKAAAGQDGQVVIPSAVNIALYQNAPTIEDVDGGDTQKLAVQKMEMEAIGTDAYVREAPLTPAGQPGAYQQGLAAPSGDVGLNTTVTYNVFQCDCLGDELIVLVDRQFIADDTDSNTWDFAGRDAGFSAFFGTADGSRPPIPDMGVYLLGGANP